MKIIKRIFSFLVSAIIAVLVLVIIWLYLENRELHRFVDMIQENNTFNEVQLNSTKRILEESQRDLDAANMVIEDLKSTEGELVYLGDFKLTYYCDERFEHICGGTGVTASGKPTEVGVTVAVDRDVIPLGSKIYIEGVGFMEAQDTGGAVVGNRIDILVEDHFTAEKLGVQNGGVWVLTIQN